MAGGRAMKFIRRAKNTGPAERSGNSSGARAPSADPASRGQSAREASPSTPRRSSKHEPEASPSTPRRSSKHEQEAGATPPTPSSASMPSSKKGLEQEVQALREQNDRLARERQEDAARKASERLAADRKVQSLEQEVEDLKSQLAQRTRDDAISDDSGGGGDGHFPCFEGPIKASAAYVPMSARTGGRVSGAGVPRKIVIAACAFIGVETALLVGFAAAYFADLQPQRTGERRAPPPGGDAVDPRESELAEERAEVPALERDLQRSMDQEKYWEKRFKTDEEYWTTRLAEVKASANLSDRPYRMITGLRAHQVPEMYGKVGEKTIWAYWYHPDTCESSTSCVLPPVVQLCSETIRRNKGSFDFRIVHMDEVDKYVNRMELPMRWRELIPAHQKDSLMNALLARYGGVAMDISTILLRPLDDYWEEMVSRGATFMGYMYRLNGMPWRHAETTSVWFLMSRREGLFSTAVRNQVIGMGDRHETGAYHHWYLALGDQTLTPILHMYNYSLPKCTEDATIVSPPASPMWDQKASMCPELEMEWSEDLMPERNDAKVILRDPREGPQLPFAFGAGMALWDVSDSTALTDEQVPGDMRSPGAPMQQESCGSPRACWQVFVRRYEMLPVPGRARLLNFVKLFAHVKELKGMSREEILSRSDSFMVTWLRLAGVS
uniref:Uncharacterized protein n=1 Tax=Alexandrium monilatum TaxID=311494 RepID=A0A7S4QZA6_9DINO